jgi:hypothetical protein
LNLQRSPKGSNAARKRIVTIASIAISFIANAWAPPSFTTMLRLKGKLLRANEDHVRDPNEVEQRTDMRLLRVHWQRRARAMPSIDN